MALTCQKCGRRKKSNKGELCQSCSSKHPITALQKDFKEQPHQLKHAPKGAIEGEYKVIE